MLELRNSDEDAFALGYGGDVFNTALYASRLGLEVSFLSAVGDDFHSRWLVRRWRADGVDCAHVREVAGATPALYLIRTDAEGERYFTYWRSASPFRHWLDEGAYVETLAGVLSGFDAVKVFPAGSVGAPGFLQALASVLPNLAVGPTGGINAGNLADYARLGNVACVGGSWMVPRAAIRQGSFGEVERLASQALNVIGACQQRSRPVP